MPATVLDNILIVTKNLKLVLKISPKNFSSQKIKFPKVSTKKSPKRGLQQIKQLSINLSVYQKDIIRLSKELVE